MKLERYETQDENNHLRYTFMSKGHSDIMKIIAYQQFNYKINIPSKGPLTAYNLAFGDRIGQTLKIDDRANSNNGDMRKVFNTVLHTIPTFFSKYPETCIVVEGSDDRRIMAYCTYVSRNYGTLSKEYSFYGVSGTIFRPFKVGTVYDRVVFLPK